MIKNLMRVRNVEFTGTGFFALASSMEPGAKCILTPPEWLFSVKGKTSIL
jgi:hypothetical protein